MNIKLYVIKVPTFPFSNLLILFLQFTSCRSPVSPWSPIRLRKTDASVPLPLTVPVQTVILYLMTAENHIIQSNCIFLSILLDVYGEYKWMYLLGSGSAISSPVAGSSLTTSLSSSLVSSHRSQGNAYFSFVNVFIRVA